MELEPKILNKSNYRYGPKANIEAWNAALDLAFFGVGSGKGIEHYLELGGYSQVIDKTLDRFLKKYKTIEKLKDLGEIDLACFFMLGEAYYKTGNINNAIGAFHVVYSQIGFTKTMLKDPVDFAHYCYLSKEYL